MFNTTISPEHLSRVLGQKHGPTAQQAEVIGAEPGPMLVVAGAGAGKTETMANRVVWLVANGYVAPEDVLGLTFTRKAAQQLAQRIRARLSTFAATPKVWEQDPTGDLAKRLESINPTVSTYDSYAGRLVKEYGLLLPVEPTARLITQTELFQIAWELVENYRGELIATQSTKNVVATLLKLASEIDNHMVSEQDIIDETRPFIERFHEVPRGKARQEFNATITKWMDTQTLRTQYLPLVRALKEELTRRQVITFGEQMTLAARLAEQFEQVGANERRKFRVVMLDEYQDTSHAQRVLLRSLFGGKDPELSVTAVGDPMQSIYGWRGATAANLERFKTDFPELTSDGTINDAPKKQLTTSFRNPQQILAGANDVSTEVFQRYNAGKRTVEKLEALEHKNNGAVQLGWFAQSSEEEDWVADQLAAAYRAPRSENEKFTAAVLVRKKKHIDGIAAALTARGVPIEIVGLSGLLRMPEVADLVAVARMLIKPQDNAAALRILTGPAVGLSAADIQGLYRRTENLSGRARVSNGDLPDDPEARLDAIIQANGPSDADSAVGLVDAIADLGEPSFYSAEGYRRLRELSAMLRHLRTYSLSRKLTDLFADIAEVFGIRTEVLTRQDPNADGAVGTAHLDRFAEEVAAFEAVPGATLRSLLDYFEVALEEEDGFEPGEVTVRSERVQILTVHKSKGLEWQHVAVIHADNGTYVDENSDRRGQKLTTWVTDVSKVPSTLRGDRKAEDNPNGAPELDLYSAENRGELQKAVEAHIEDFRKTYLEEVARLFYVAITRSEKHLIVSGSARSGGTTIRQPYVFLEKLRSLESADVVHWAEESTEAETNEAEEQVVANFPPDALGQRRQAVERAAAAVRRAIDAQDTADPDLIGELGLQWQRDVNALIDEHRRLNSSQVQVTLGRELTATDLVGLRRDPVFFARRTLRPVPFKPNAYAKRGTAFHEWLERRFGATTLLDDTQLETDPTDTSEISGSEAILAQLKEKFLSSEWAERQPRYVEAPFEVAIGAHIVRGRMDAVFHEGNDPAAGWHVVDWKTGQPPTGKDLEIAAIQLAVYRYAWARLLSEELGHEVDPQQVRAAFYYVSAGWTYEPGKLPDAAELAGLLDIEPGSQN
ncbi:UvrD-helicase domain-containing protein [Staphylococcus chromogenes]|nr:UvrD-helicase domain-containing protein [Staphylococcus chromogenes]